MKTLIITIDSDSGEVTVDAKGFKGKACVEATAKLIKELGVAGKDTKKPEFYQEDKQQVQA